MLSLTLTADFVSVVTETAQFVRCSIAAIAESLRTVLCWEQPLRATLAPARGGSAACMLVPYCRNESGSKDAVAQARGSI